jgi:putative sterol carrier protein
MADAPTSAQQVFDAMPSRFNKEAAKGLKAIFGFDLSGDGGGQWHIDIDNDKCEVKTGAAAAPSITLSMTASDYVDMSTGKLNRQMAFMSGKLKISGDMGLAMKFASLFQ